MPKSVRSPLIHFNHFFRDLCSKVFIPNELIRIEKDIIIILYQLEKIFPPALFDFMVHLTIHLASEARIGGHVYYRWMYPIERLVIFFYHIIFYHFLVFKNIKIIFHSTF